MLLMLPAFGRDRVWDIEFFGYKGIDIAAVRQALPVHEGDLYAHDDTKNKVRRAVSDALGRAPTDVQGVCCNDSGDFVLFIGLPGSSSKNFSYNAPPEGHAQLSEEITALQDRVDQALEAAVRRGGESAREDDSAGYALSRDPALRTLQLQVRNYALAHQDEVLSVLESSSDRRQRQMAANTLGYARKSARQVQALVHAARDPDNDVRNEAVRALGVLASSDKEVTQQIPPESFIQMINSGIWTDRNKGSFVLSELTRSRDPRLLEALGATALDSLIEMARWRSTGHAIPARIVLGRIAGVPEERLLALASGPPEPILDALKHR